MSSTPDIAIRGIRQTIPSGYVLGRVSTGSGQAELIPLKGFAATIGSYLAPAFAIHTTGNGISLNNGSTLAVEWNAGTINSLGTHTSGTLAISSGSLFVTTNYQAGTLTTFHAGLTLTSGTLTPDWNGGVVTSLGTASTGTLSISSGTLSATYNNPWQAGTVTAFGTNTSGTLSLAAGTLSVVTPNEWTAGTVASVGTGLTLSAGVLSIGSGGTSGITEVQTASASGSVSGGTVTATFASTPTVGNLMLFYVGGFDNTVTPPAGVTLVISQVGSTTQKISLFSRTVQAGDGTTWAFTPSTDVIQVWASEWNGVASIVTASSNLGNPSSSGATSTGPSTTNVAIGNPTLCGFEADAATSSVAGTGYTQDAFLQTTNHPMVVVHATSGYSGVAPSIVWTGVSTTQPVVALTTTLVGAGQQWNAGTVTALGTATTGTLSISSGTISATYNNPYSAGTLTSFGTGLTLTSGTLTPNYSAGTLTTFNSGLTLASGTLTPDWQGGSVTAIGSNLTLAAGTLSANPAVVSSNVTAGAAVVATLNTVFDVTHIVLAAGTYLLWGSLGILPQGSTVLGGVGAWINTSSATTPADIVNGGALVLFTANPTTGNSAIVPIGMMVVSISSSTTFYLSGIIGFSGGAPSGYGFIGAVRL